MFYKFVLTQCQTRPVRIGLQRCGVKTKLFFDEFGLIKFASYFLNDSEKNKIIDWIKADGLKRMAKNTYEQETNDVAEKN